MLPSASARVRRTSLATIGFLVLVVGGMTATAATVHVSSATIISGQIGETASITPIASPTGGKVAKIRVKNGQEVKVDQELFVLADDGLKEQRAALAGQLHAMMVRDARITAELSGNATVEMPADLADLASTPAVSHALALEQQQLTTDVASVSATRRAYQAQLDTQQGSLATLKEQQANAALQADQPQFTGVPASAYESQIQATETQIIEITAQMDQAEATSRSNLLGLAVDNQTAMADAKIRLKQADAQLADLHVKSAAGGIVSDSILVAPGQYLPPTVTALNLVSNKNALVVTARLPVGDAPFVSQGDRVTVDLTTGDKLRTTSVKGDVATISANPASQGKAAATYSVGIVVSAKDAKSVRNKSALANGMPAQVHIESGSQSILHYLVAPIAERMRFAFHER